MRRIFSTAAVVSAALLALTACGGGGGNPLDTTSAAPTGGASSAAAGKVVVGSANFPENVLLGSIYAQALKAKGVDVEEKPNIGSREVLIGQIKSGGLTVLPEYNGALLAYLDPKATAATTEDVNTALKSKLPPEL
ncbi:MAG: glycine/betaine ABC transporter substrate-binding protein, partial [Nonomuraea sp.]|nr:glycine/betaine ABC transporter substrate-binding protein [Nonomuraea sp.]